MADHRGLGRDLDDLESDLGLGLVLGVGDDWSFGSNEERYFLELFLQGLVRVLVIE